MAIINDYNALSHKPIKRRVVMEYEIISVNRQHNQVEEIVAKYGQIEITFQKTTGGRITELKKSLAPPGQKVTSLYLPRDIYVHLRQQVESIFSGKNNHTKKKTQKADYLYPWLEKIISEAHHYNKRVTNTARALQQKVSKTERDIFLESIKDLAYHHCDFPHLHPLELWHYENLRRLGIRLLRGGVLEFNRTDRSANRENRLQFKMNNLDAAIRMQQHMLDQYLGSVEHIAGETDRIEGLQTLAKEIRNLALSWKSFVNDSAMEPETLLAKIKELASNIIEDLEKCRNPHKGQARDQARHLTEPYDSLNRINPGAQAARVTSLLAHLNKRLSEMDSIIPIILNRKKALANKKENIVTCFVEATKQLEAVADNWSNYLLTDNRLQTNLGQVLCTLGQASIQPYRAQADQAAFFLLAARQHADDHEIVNTMINKAKKIIADQPFP